jgi:peptidase C39-like protein/tetratricopeptide repeat protein
MGERPYRMLRPLAPLLLIGLLAGCATPPPVSDLRRDPGGLPPKVELADVPFFPQEDLWCGPASIAMVLAWSGLAVTQDDMARQVYTPGREGTLQTDLIAGARRNGRLAVEVRDLRGLVTELAAGNPVLVFQNLGLAMAPVWHYAVAYGYELEPANLVLHSGLEPRHVTALGTFERTWARAGHWALVVTAPDRLPATAQLDTVLAAALGIERAGRAGEAAAAYETIAAKWPESFGAWMGLGNTRYALKDFAAAERAFRKASEADPKAPQAWNNLAYALAGQGRRADAIAAAERAVALGGEQADPYRATLQELSAAPTS